MNCIFISCRNPDIPEKLRKWAQKQLAQEITFETKRVDRADFFSKGFNQPTEPKLMIWVKVKVDIGENTGTCKIINAQILNIYLIEQNGTCRNHTHSGKVKELMK